MNFKKFKKTSLTPHQCRRFGSLNVFYTHYLAAREKIMDTHLRQPNNQCCSVKAEIDSLIFCNNEGISNKF